MSDSIHVAIRIRPLIEREIKNACPVSWNALGSDQIHQVDRKGNPVHGSSFTFDRVFPSSSTNREVYQEVGRLITESVVDGFHGTIFAYGQTSSGKTFTMMGEDHDPGVIKQAVQDIFLMQSQRPNRDFLFRVSYMELYNEKILDLISNRSNLAIKENLEGQVFVGDLEEVLVKSVEDVFHVMDKGERNRHFGDTAMNEHSSRSHTIFKMVVESRLRESGEDSPVNVSHLNLVDLAGSEKAGQMGTTGSRFKEGVHINKSLLTLSQVISKLSEGAFVNYRDSKLTRILQNSLGGNSRTAIICTVTPTSVEQTQSTLNFAVRAKRIQNKPVVNEVLSEAARNRMHQRLIARLQKQMQQQQNLIAELQKDNLTRTSSLQGTEDFKRSSRRETWCGKFSAPTALLNSQSIFRVPDTLSETAAVSTLRPILEDEEFSPCDKILTDQDFEDFPKDVQMYNNPGSVHVTTRRRRQAFSTEADVFPDVEFEEQASFLGFSGENFIQLSPDKNELKDEILVLKKQISNMEESLQKLQEEHQELQEYTIIERQINLNGTVFGEESSFVFITPKNQDSRVLRFSFACQTDFPSGDTISPPNTSFGIQTSFVHTSEASTQIDSTIHMIKNNVNKCDLCVCKTQFKETNSEAQTKSEQQSLELPGVVIETKECPKYALPDQTQTCAKVATQTELSDTKALSSNLICSSDLFIECGMQTEDFPCSVSICESNCQTDDVFIECGIQTEEFRLNLPSSTSYCQTEAFNFDFSCQTDQQVESTDQLIQTEQIILPVAIVQTDIVDISDAVVQTELKNLANVLVQTEQVTLADCASQTQELNYGTSFAQTEISEAREACTASSDVEIQTACTDFINAIMQTCTPEVASVLLQTSFQSISKNSETQTTSTDLINAVSQTYSPEVASVLLQTSFKSIKENAEIQTTGIDLLNGVVQTCSLDTASVLLQTSFQNFSENAEVQTTNADLLNAVVQTCTPEVASVLLQTSFQNICKNAEVQTAHADLLHAVVQTYTPEVASVLLQTSFQSTLKNAEMQTSSAELLNEVVQTCTPEVASVLLQTSFQNISTNLNNQTEVGDSSPLRSTPNVSTPETEKLTSCRFCHHDNRESILNKSCQAALTPVPERNPLNCSMTIEDLEEEISHWKTSYEETMNWAKVLKEESASQVLEFQKRLDDKEKEVNSMNCDLSSLTSRVTELEASLKTKIHDNAVQKNDFIKFQRSHKELQEQNTILKEKINYYQSKAEEANNKLRRAENDKMDNTIVHIKKRKGDPEDVGASNFNQNSGDNPYPGLGCAGRIRISQLEKENTLIKRKYNHLLQAYRNTTSSSSSTDRIDSKENIKIEDEKQISSSESSSLRLSTSQNNSSACAGATQSSNVSDLQLNKLEVRYRFPENKAPVINIRAPKVTEIPQVSPPAKSSIPVKDDFALEMSNYMKSKGFCSRYSNGKMIVILFIIFTLVSILMTLLHGMILDPLHTRLNL